MVEARIIVAHDMELLDDVPERSFHDDVVARTFCNWSEAAKKAAAQTLNPSNRHVDLQRETILGYISPIQTVAAQTVSAVNREQYIIFHSDRNETNIMQRRLKVFEMPH